MNTRNNETKAPFNSARYAAFGLAMGLAAMVAMFIVGLVKGNAGMTVMAATTSALLVGVWSSTNVAAKKQAAKKAAQARD